MRVYATSSERGSRDASGGLEVAGLWLPVTRIGPARVPVPGGGAELAFRLKAGTWRETRKALRRHKKVLVRLGVVGTDLTGVDQPRGAGDPARRRPASRALAVRAGGPPRSERLDGDDVRNEFDNCPNGRTGASSTPIATGPATPATTTTTPTACPTPPTTAA